MEELYIDADNQVMGRLASTIAKELLKGRKVFIVNAGKVVISGKPEYVFKKYKERLDRGDPYKGPFFPKYPDRMLKRVIRGMLPKNFRGRDALKRLRVYNTIPEMMEGKIFQKFEVSANKLECKHTTIGKVSEKIGGRG